MAAHQAGVETAMSRFRKMYIFDAVITTSAKVTVLASSLAEACERLADGAWAKADIGRADDATLGHVKKGPPTVEDR